MKRNRQAGYSLIEMVVVVFLLGIILAPMSVIVYHLIWIPGEKSDTLTVLHNVRQAVRWITEDSRQALTFTAGTEPDYGTFTWTDRSSDPATSYSVRYYYSSTDDRLMREETVGATPSTIVVSENIQNFSDVTFQEADGLVEASVTATIDNSRKTISETSSLSAQMRLELAVDGTTPPPYTLAWDDIESGGWTGGTGWLWEWYTNGNSSVVSTNNPYEGSYHVQLLGGTWNDGYVDRAIDLSGQSNVRLQFWAKAYNFESGETAECLVSSNGQQWDTVRTWVDGEDDNVYRFEDIDLSSYSMTGEFYIAFAADMSSTGDYFWFDDLKVVRTWPAS